MNDRIFAHARRKRFMKSATKKFFLFSFILFMLLIGTSCGGECKHKEMTENVVPPSCGTRGYTEFTCVDCSFSFESDFVIPSPHQLRATTVAPSCTEGGYTLNKCELCDYSYKTEPTAVLEHTLTSSTTQPTCTSVGYTTQKCDVCGFESKIDYLAQKDHNISKKTIAPTCDKEGYTEYSCSTCSFSFVSDKTSATAHCFASTTIPPTCLLQGYTKNTCTVCSKEIISEYTAPKGHVYTQTVYRATSSRDGYTLHDCDNCDYHYTSDFEYSYAIFTGAYTAESTPIAKGVDVSSYNGSLNWQGIAASGVDFAIIRAGTSLSGADPLFSTNYSAAKAAGLDVGVYYYIEAKSVAEALKYADSLKKILAGKKFEYPIYFDFEKDALGTELGKELLTQMCVAFIEDLQANGYFAALYTNNNWLENFFDKDLVTRRYDIWYARYLTDSQEIASPVWKLEKFGATMGIWQYTDEGSINGVTSSIPFDLNLCYKDYPTLIKRSHYNGY